jgi:type IV pilus assembly protein PilP
MKKIKFAIASAFIIVFVIEIFSFAAEVKNTPPAVPTAPAERVAPAETATAEAPAQVQQKPPLAPTATGNYSYNPAGKPDPFRPLVEQSIEAKKESKKKEELSMFPLQRAEAENYRVVGIAGDKDHRVAIAEDTGKKFYPLVIGTHIGLHKGKVIEILADRVIIEEYPTKKAKRVILKLRKN